MTLDQVHQSEELLRPEWLAVKYRQCRQPHRKRPGANVSRVLQRCCRFNHPSYHSHRHWSANSPQVCIRADRGACSDLFCGSVPSHDKTLCWFSFGSCFHFEGKRWQLQLSGYSSESCAPNTIYALPFALMQTSYRISSTLGSRNIAKASHSTLAIAVSEKPYPKHSTPCSLQLAIASASSSGSTLHPTCSSSE